jgi:phosphatidate cytidylyltransferase
MKLNNTAIRIIVSVIAIPVILFAAIAGNGYFLAFTLVLAILGYGEFIEFARKKSSFSLVVSGYATVIALVANAYFHAVDYYVIIIVSLIVTMLVELFRNKQSAINNLGATFLGILYVGILFSSLVELRQVYNGLEYERGGYLIIAILATIWICDSAAYFGGTLLGKHKLFPRVSPKKSWEGAIFGFSFAIFAVVIAHNTIVTFLSSWDAIIIGIIVGTIGQMGDLVESLLKRDAGIKDSSHLIPGHGGMLDRFDSLLFVAPVVLLYIKFFVSK